MDARTTRLCRVDGRSMKPGVKGVTKPASAGASTRSVHLFHAGLPADVFKVDASAEAMEESTDSHKNGDNMDGEPGEAAIIEVSASSMRDASLG